MGKEIIMKEVLKQAKIMLAAGIIGFLLTGGYALFNIMNGNISSLAMLCIVLAVISIVCAGMGIHGLTVPEKSFAVKSNPEIFDMAEEHFSRVTYKDEYVVISDRMISAANNPTTVSYMDEVYLVYIEKNKTNFVTTGKSLVFDTARGEHRINVTNLSDQLIQDNIMNIFSKYCPNAAFGYSNENLTYLQNMRISWQQTHQR